MVSLALTLSYRSPCTIYNYTVLLTHYNPVWLSKSGPNLVQLVT